MLPTLEPALALAACNGLAMGNGKMWGRPGSAASPITANANANTMTHKYIINIYITCSEIY